MGQIYYQKNQINEARNMEWLVFRVPLAIINKGYAVGQINP